MNTMPSWRLISLAQAQAFFDLGDTVHGIEVKVDDIYRVREVAAGIQYVVGPAFWTRDWMEMNRNLFAALRQEKVIMFIILVLIILVAAFNIVSTLVMLVMEKHADIAILKAMGARRSSIYQIFVMEGLIIGRVGTVLGTVAGLAFTSKFAGDFRVGGAAAWYSLFFPLMCIRWINSPCRFTLPICLDCGNLAMSQFPRHPLSGLECFQA